MREERGKWKIENGKWKMRVELFLVNVPFPTENTPHKILSYFQNLQPLTNQLKFVSKFIEFFIDKSIYGMYNKNTAQDIVLTIPHRGRKRNCDSVKPCYIIRLQIPIGDEKKKLQNN